MATHLRIHSLTVATARAQRTFTFDSPLTFVTGATAMGKSTLLMLIKHALGGTAVLTDAVNRHVIHVDITVTLNSATMTLRRRVSTDTYVQLVNPDPAATDQEWPVNPRNPGATSIARHLMDQLQIPADPFSSTRQGDNDRTVNLTFDDVFRYCYLQARDIDRSIVGHLDKSSHNPRRVALFERAFRITDPTLEQLRLRRGALRAEAAMLENDIAAVTRFIRTDHVDPDNDLAARYISVAMQLADVEQALQDAREDVTAATVAEDHHRAALAAARTAAARFRDQATNQAASVQARTAALAQLRLDLAKTERMVTAAGLLAPFEFVACPRCAQSLDDRPTAPDECLLCCQPLAPVDLTDTAAATADVTRLRDQINETQELLNTDVTTLQQLQAAAQHSEEVLDSVLRAYDDATRTAASPLLDHVADLSGRAEAQRSQLDAIDRDRRQWQNLADLSDRLDELRLRERALKSDIALATTAQQEASAGRLADLSAAFAAEVNQLGIPVDGPARIDATTYLPMIGDTDFENLQASGGGATTALAIAYHLSLLTFALDHPDVLLPSLLIIDSPRKAMSNAEADQQLGRKVYDRITTLAEAYQNRLQIIVADSDIPEEHTAAGFTIELTSEQSTVPGVVNTGVGRGRFTTAT